MTDKPAQINVRLTGGLREKIEAYREAETSRRAELYRKGDLDYVDITLSLSDAVRDLLSYALSRTVGMGRNKDRGECLYCVIYDDQTVKVIDAPELDFGWEEGARQVIKVKAYEGDQ